MAGKQEDADYKSTRLDTSTTMNVRRKILTLATLLLLVTLVGFVLQIRSSVFHPPPLPVQSSYQAVHVMQASAPGTSDLTTRPTTQSSGRKKIVYACRSLGCGGLADRQKGIVGTYVLALMLGRDFGIQLTTPCDLSQLLGHNKVRWEVADDELEQQMAKNAVGTYYRVDAGAVEFAKELLASPNLTEKLPDSVSLVMWNMEVVQYLRQHALASSVPGLLSASKTLPDIYRDVLRDLFILSPALQAVLDKFRASVPGNRTLVCAQVRLGTNPGFPDVMQINSIENYPVLSQFLSKFSDSERFRIFLATDSQQIVEAMSRDFPKVLLTIPGPITHSDKTQGDKACDGFKKAILDEYALATCDVLVISESGLGKVAAFMRGTDKELYLFTRDKIVPFKRDGVLPGKKDGW